MARTRGRYVLRGLAFAGVAAAGYAFGISGDSASAQPPAPGMQPPGMLPPGMQPIPKGPAAQPAPLPEPDRRVVAYINGNQPVTREELGDFLIARGGHEKLELLVNKKIIEAEAAKRNVTVTTVEIRAGLEEDLRGLSIDLKDFEQHILPRYHKTLYEWVEDVIRPRLLLQKMCRDQVKVTDEDIQKVFENTHGERRQAKLICWNRKDLKDAQRQWAEARKGDVEFDSVARQQADPNLAAACGLVKPVGKFPEAEADTTIVDALYKLKVGEMSGILDVPAGLMCVKCVAIIPPDKDAKLDDKTKSAIRNEIFARKLEREVPKFFKKLKDAAKPNLILKGPPSAAEFREGVSQIINQTGGPPKLPAPPPALPAAPRP